MTGEIAALQQCLGVEAPVIQYSIDAASARYFADSIMDPDARYHVCPVQPGSAGAHSDVPPTFFGGALGLKDVIAGDPRTMSAIDLPLPAGWPRLATGDGFEFYLPVRTGMTLLARERFVDVYEKQGRSGHLIFYTMEKTFSLPSGEPVLKRTLYCVAREPHRTTPVAPAGARVPEAPEAGIPLPVITVGPITVRYLAMFATATAEFVDIHYDADYARAVGLPGPIIQGLFKTALIARMLKNWAGDGNLIRSLNVRHRGMDLAGSTLTVGGTITSSPAADATGSTECHVWVRNREGVSTTSGTARITHPAGTSGAAQSQSFTDDVKEHLQR